VLISFVCESADLAQQMICRAGRNNEFAYVELLFFENHKFSSDANAEAFYRGQGCIRHRLHRILDGEGLASFCKRSLSSCSFCASEGELAISDISEELSRLSADISPRKESVKRGFESAVNEFDWLFEDVDSKSWVNLGMVSGESGSF
jgi:hypothetical protein